ncbi:hypothetical protein C8J57DRAFT_1252514 [Mycena rebaudengoi]|nr:hypothetical protein C8J57DRAFT_1252514 [Mycena rebaudengoi]
MSILRQLDIQVGLWQLPRGGSVHTPLPQCCSWGQGSSAHSGGLRTPLKEETQSPDLPVMSQTLIQLTPSGRAIGALIAACVALSASLSLALAPSSCVPSTTSTGTTVPPTTPIAPVAVAPTLQMPQLHVQPTTPVLSILQTPIGNPPPPPPPVPTAGATDTACPCRYGVHGISVMYKTRDDTLAAAAAVRLSDVKLMVSRNYDKLEVWVTGELFEGDLIFCIKCSHPLCTPHMGKKKKSGDKPAKKCGTPSHFQGKRVAYLEVHVTEFLSHSKKKTMPMFYQNFVPAYWCVFPWRLALNEEPHDKPKPAPENAEQAFKALDLDLTKEEAEHKATIQTETKAVHSTHEMRKYIRRLKRRLKEEADAEHKEVSPSTRTRMRSTR